MTFLSLTPDTLYADAAAWPKVRTASRPASASLFAHGLAMAVLAITLTVPGGVAHAKWSKLNLILDQVQHRCMASLTP